MALKDRFDKLISYFDTDEASDVEENVSETTVQRPAPQQQARQTPQVQEQSRPERTRPSRTQPQTSESVQQRSQPTSRQPREEGRNVHQLTQRREVQAQAVRQGQTTTIALKYPRKYEDAQEIVDLLIVNECVLIDFQYMLDAQARRCLDFIDGASKVLYGTLQKVGSSMYLLTPSNVVVDIEEIALSNNGQDVSFDFDMKRR